MNVLHRLVLPGINALFITALLIYAMFLLIDMQTPDLVRAKLLKFPEWVAIPKDEPPVIFAAKPTKPKEQELQPVIEKEPIELEVNITSGVGTPDLIFKKPVKTAVFHNDQLVRVLAYPPRYPSSALNRNIEGYVVVGFSVSESGQVYDAFVIEAEPKGVFEKSALKAIAKFKYKARYVNNQAVSTDGQRYMFSYEIDE